MPSKVVSKNQKTEYSKYIIGIIFGVAIYAMGSYVFNNYIVQPLDVDMIVTGATGGNFKKACTLRTVCGYKPSGKKGETVRDAWQCTRKCV